MFLLGQVPRNLVLDAGRSGYHAMSSRNTAAGNGSAFSLYNPPAAAGTAAPLVLVTGVNFDFQNEETAFSLHRSEDTTDLDALVNTLAAGNCVANYFGQALDAFTVLAEGASSTYAPVLASQFFDAESQSQRGLLPLEYPLVLPPGQALVAKSGVSVGTRGDRCSWRWFRI